MIKEALVSICMITYNHEDYVSEAIESILNQKTTFRFELIISDDCSTDNTYEICKAYRDRFPEIIQIIRHDQNIGVCANFYSTIASANGKYVAICEGDDYWIHPYKLQMQVDYMEANFNTVLTYHNAKVCGLNKSSLFINIDTPSHKVDLEEVLDHWAIPTASVLFRNKSLSIPKDFPEFINSDYSLELLIKKEGDFYYDSSIMSVYRKHLGSVSEELKKKSIKSFREIIHLLNYTKFKYDVCDREYFDKAINKYRNLILKEERSLNHPLLKYFSWRYYKRKIFAKLRIQRIPK